MPQKTNKTTPKKTTAKKTSSNARSGNALMPSILATMVIVVAILASYFVYITYFKTPEASLGNQPATTSAVITDQDGESVVIPGGTAAVHYIDVGQGDATLIVAPTGETMLIDAGERKEAATYLEKLKIKKLDYLVFTHYDFDHIGGGDDILALCDVKNVIASDYEPHNKTGKNLITLIEEEGANFIHPDKGDTFMLGDVKIEVLTRALTEANKESDENDNSIILMMTFGANKFLFTGDAEDKRESEIISSYGKKLDADVYKAGHHGADNASSAELMALVTPDYGVFSCGEGNSYGHPRKGALERVAAYARVILRTDHHGDIVITSSGVDLVYKTQKEAPVTLDVSYAVICAILPEKAYQEA